MSSREQDAVKKQPTTPSTLIIPDLTSTKGNVIAIPTYCPLAPTLGPCLPWLAGKETLYHGHPLRWHWHWHFSVHDACSDRGDG